MEANNEWDCEIKCKKRNEEKQANLAKKNPIFCDCAKSGVQKSECIESCKTRENQKICLCGTSDESPENVKTEQECAAHCAKETTEDTAPTKTEEKSKTIFQKPPKLHVPIPGVNLTKIQVTTKGTGQINVPWIAQYIIGIYRYSMGIATILAVIMVMIAGVVYLTSAGNPQRIQQAKSYLTGSVIGVVVLASAYLILNLISPQLTTFGPIELEEVEQEVLDAPTGDAPGLPVPTIAEATSGEMAGVDYRMGDFGQYNSSANCTPSEIVDLAEIMRKNKICQGPCHCAATVSRVLRGAGCKIRGTGGSGAISKQAEKSLEWVTKPISSFPDVTQLPVGILWKQGHVGLSIGKGRMIESTTGIYRCWKERKQVMEECSEARKKCSRAIRKKGSTMQEMLEACKDFDQCAIANGECPTTIAAAYLTPYCNYCAGIPQEAPNTGHYAGRNIIPSAPEGFDGGKNCGFNQCMSKRASARIKAFKTITYNPAWVQ